MQFGLLRVPELTESNKDPAIVWMLYGCLSCYNTFPFSFVTANCQSHFLQLTFPYTSQLPFFIISDEIVQNVFINQHFPKPQHGLSLSLCWGCCWFQNWYSPVWVITVIIRWNGVGSTYIKQQGRDGRESLHVDHTESVRKMSFSGSHKKEPET